ncbi:hypothetical protein BG004_002910, partial [Podila humilis]
MYNAIRLTACEIATANMPVPIECDDLTTAAQAKNQDAAVPGAESQEIARCVQSLGRVPQLWTSYSGYFREVKVMCLAVQYSLEQDELQRLQRNLTRTYADQITRLRAQRQELIENHRLETEQLQEIQRIHRDMTAQVNTILTSTSTLRNTFSSILEDVSKIVQNTGQGVEEQGVALESMRHSNKEFLTDFQLTLFQTMEAVSCQSQFWNDTIAKNLLRFQDFDQLAEEQLVRVAQANQGLDMVVSHIDHVATQLRELKDQAVQGTQELVQQQDKGSEDISNSTMKILQNMIRTLDTLDNHTQSSWRQMIQSFKSESSDFQKEISELLVLTASDIGSMATESQEKIEELNNVFHTLKARQWTFVWPLQLLLRSFGMEAAIDPAVLASTVIMAMILITNTALY